MNQQANLKTDATTIRVELGARGYDIVIGAGLMAQAGTHLRAALAGARAAIVTDENLAALHLSALHKALAQEGIEAATITIPAGEASKRFERLQDVIARRESGGTAAKIPGLFVGQTRPAGPSTIEIRND